MSELARTRRLFVSGFPSDQVSRRLSQFVRVAQVDGADLRNGIGDERDFVHVTVEATNAEVSKR